ncbi:MAG: anti-sigma factor [Candidatus Zixiibacteriota bacterium]
MNCSETQIYVDDYLAGVLSPDDKVRFEEHLGQCPDCQRMVDGERRWLEIMRSDKEPDPGEKYWSGLESRIMARTFDDDNIIQPSFENNKTGRAKISFLNYLIPVAAAFLIFALSLNDNLFKHNMTPSESIEIASIDQTKIEYDAKIMINSTKRPEILGTILMSPPGSLGRNLMISRLKHK